MDNRTFAFEMGASQAFHSVVINATIVRSVSGKPPDWLSDTSAYPTTRH